MISAGRRRFQGQNPSWRSDWSKLIPFRIPWNPILWARKVQKIKFFSRFCDANGCFDNVLSYLWPRLKPTIDMIIPLSRELWGIFNFRPDPLFVLNIGYLSGLFSPGRFRDLTFNAPVYIWNRLKPTIDNWLSPVVKDFGGFSFSVHSASDLFNSSTSSSILFNSSPYLLPHRVGPIQRYWKFRI